MDIPKITTRMLRNEGKVLKSEKNTFLMAITGYIGEHDGGGST